MTFDSYLIEISEVTETKVSRRVFNKAILRVYMGLNNNKKIILQFIYLLPEMSETQRAQDEYNNNNLCINA